ncbi:DJ-1/PfpI family protein [Acuticoccus sp. I52.16.1]|uniref:DJ-1/PfpI family protein n=1 Tax=Acuticoccus sp. I52.16.1 TaxID=2928472 RepID=UPI001FD35AA8|nr:DJ-1/PfpI family protein [Acuticoccus sp. I52.16.1]UOM35731.1 DJ-1/PfpI family protein [Acuticoccus sp. I52.16.1]
MDRLQIGLLVFPKLTQLDLTGPFEVFARLPDTDVNLVWKTLDPVVSDVGLHLLPTHDLASCPELDVICIPGGPGVNPLLNDPEVLDFVRRQAEGARYVTSVCTGALVLGAAGLLKGYRAATHWASMDFLESFGATPADVRVCIDRDRVTGGGVTAGIDFGLTLAAELTDAATAQRIQLYMEYNPQPPFPAGSPHTAPAEVVDAFRAVAAAMIEERAAAVDQAAAKL